MRWIHESLSTVNCSVCCFPMLIIHTLLEDFSSWKMLQSIPNKLSRFCRYISLFNDNECSEKRFYQQPHPGLFPGKLADTKKMAFLSLSAILLLFSLVMNQHSASFFSITFLSRLVIFHKHRKFLRAEHTHKNISCIFQFVK